MEPCRCLPTLFFSLFLVAFASSATFINDEVFVTHGHGGRNLLQMKKSCTVDFESQNYTIITSKCKGPQYSAKLCCDALKEFACPFTDELNDGSNDCATTMFSYINIYGKYPPGLFASECREGKEGLECPEEMAASMKNQMSSGYPSYGLSLVATLVIAVVLILVSY